MNADLLVVGSGVAGCSAALAADDAGADVTLVTKATAPDDATSYWAQGGIAVSRGDPDAFREDVLAAGDGACDPAAVDTLVAAADDAVREVLIDRLGVPFDGDDEFDFGREAAHSENRILHVDAATGAAVLPRFLSHLRTETSVDVVEDTAALDLVTHEGRVHGALLESGGDVEPCVAGATLLATGGIGAAYGRTTNPPGATGDGVAMAALAGADVADMEYVQFHPTACVVDSEGANPAGDRPGTGDGEVPFLVSEAVRGEGAVLRDGDGERFMPDRHPDADLAPRDVVARAVRERREATGEVRLDVSGVAFAAEFPGLAERCREHGVDPDEGIPVAPAQHFLCGGIDVDRDGRASLDRLFAAGECARTGVHGANRLASTSLLEGLVFGRRAGRAAAGFDPEPVETPDLRDSDPALPERFAAEKFHRLRSTMSEHVGIERTPDGLRKAGAGLRRLKGEVDAYTRTRTARELYELRNATVCGLLVARAAAENDTSRGCHHLAAESHAD
ncbi:L-aspartate oxidase [Halorarius halobius]|uniref:L-aspartate oxidase n=1 Tax=Halorarius halobius TaxID=2962671 RepID=UPI0020CE8AB7|nr:FAD-dependent oxidoreductase [Halorarius halobius]